VITAAANKESTACLAAWSSHRL